MKKPNKRTRDAMRELEKGRGKKATLQELVELCDLTKPMSIEEREWLDAPPVGKEII